ncbi:MAG: hemolysin family protein [Thermoplasmatota archaeon]
MQTVLVVIFLVVFIIVLIFLSGWFSGTETALTNLGPSAVASMKREGDRNVKYVIRLKRRMDRTLITILIGNNVVNIVLSSVAAIIANELFAEIGVTIMVGVITFLVILFGEITPKNSAIFNSRKKAIRSSRAIYFLSVALAPLVYLFVFLSGVLIRLMGGSTKDARLFTSDEEIKGIVTLSEEEGVIKPIEREIIHKVFTFGDRKIRDVMVPIENVFHLEEDLKIARARRKLYDSGFTRVPYVNSKGRVIGVLNSKDLLGTGKGRIRGLLRKPNIVNDSDDVTDVFSSMKDEHIHLSIVRNVEGDHVGIVTLEDIIEELVGEIYDEFFETKSSNIR